MASVLPRRWATYRQKALIFSEDVGRVSARMGIEEPFSFALRILHGLGFKRLHVGNRQDVRLDITKERHDDGLSRLSTNHIQVCTGRLCKLRSIRSPRNRPGITEGPQRGNPTLPSPMFSYYLVEAR